MGSVEMTPEVAKQLREPFAPELVGKLPRIWCRNCSEARKRGQPACDQHRRVRCGVCRNNITDAHFHLDYVGHAEVTDRFLQVDPQWEWEPMAFGPDGLPAMDRYGGLWIRLTIAGKTRIGYGHADGKEGPDAIKESIGDALRNAGMRFGVGLDLWGAKFKEADQQQGETGSEGDWENAQPVRPSREQIIEKGQQHIAAATEPAHLAELTGRVAAFEADGSITTEDAASLMAAIRAREVELNGNQTPEPAEVAA